LFLHLKQTYSRKRVFLTGHTGFKGAWLLAILKELGADVKGYALEPDTEPNLYELIKGDKLCQSVIADIRDKERVEKELLDFQPDFVFHLAAQSLVRRSYEKPVETYEINVLGTSNLLDTARRLEKACNVVIVTTDKVYENLERDIPYKESDPLGGFDPYSSSKACAEITTASFRQSFFNSESYNSHQKAIASARAGNVIGGGDWAKDRIIPDFIRALTKNKPLWVRNPDSVRPWQHVLEPLSGYLYLGMKMAENPSAFAQAYNFGPNAEDNLTVKQLVELALKIWGSGEYQFLPEENAPHEAKLLQLDISKAINQLGWKPKWDSKKAIEMTLDWYKNYKNNALEITEAQIRQYLEE
jgi:CDP-glucose 4,6-dehydratase